MKHLFAFKFHILAALFLMTTAYTCEFTEFNTPSTVLPTTPFSVSGIYKNLNETDWGTLPVDVILSYDNRINEEDKLLGSVPVALGPYETKNFSLNNLVAGSEWYAGKYFLIVKQADNMMYREIAIDGTPNLGADYLPKSLYVWGTYNPGDTFFFSYTLKNVGLLPAGPCKVRCYLSEDLNVSANESIWITPVNTSTPGGGTKEFTVSTAVIPPNVLPDHEYRLIIVADANNQITETVEWNNRVSVKIKTPPQFAPTPSEAKSRAEASEMKASSASITISPNPASDYLNITFSLEKPARVSYDVFDQAGRMVSRIEEQELQPRDYSQQVSLREIPNGVYFVRVTVNGEPVTKKIVVQR